MRSAGPTTCYTTTSPQQNAHAFALSLERHANLVYDAFAAKARTPVTRSRRITTSSRPPASRVTALALMGESKDAERWAALARAHHHRAGQLLSPDGYYYEGMEYWIFSTPWLVHFLDAWEHSTGESLWERDVFRNWKTYLAHTLLPDGQTVVDFGDIWEGALTRARPARITSARIPAARCRVTTTSCTAWPRG